MSSSRTLYFQQNPTVVTQLWLKWEARLAGMRAPLSGELNPTGPCLEPLGLAAVLEYIKVLVEVWLLLAIFDKV